MLSRGNGRKQGGHGPGKLYLWEEGEIRAGASGLNRIAHTFGERSGLNYLVLPKHLN